MSFRSYFDVPGEDRSGLAHQVAEGRQRIEQRLQGVEAIIAVMSGKGGVGKSYVVAGLALAAAASGRSVGVLDADLRSPTVARLLDASGPLRIADDGVHPAIGEAGIRIVSSDFLLADGRPLAWRGPEEGRYLWQGALETAVVHDFLGDVAWGILGLLFIDLPPGADGFTELDAILPTLSGVLTVTLPSEESRRSVRRAMHAARQHGMRLLGVVENMSGYACADCRETRPLFPGDAGASLAEEFDVPLLATIPFASAGRGSGGDPFEKLYARIAEALP